MRAPSRLASRGCGEAEVESVVPDTPCRAVRDGQPAWRHSPRRGRRGPGRRERVEVKENRDRSMRRHSGG